MKDTTEQVFLADTYALIEIIGGNINYKEYSNQILLTTKFNLAELYYSLLNDYGKETAEHYFNVYAEFLIPISFSSIKKAMELKLQYKKEKLSYVDCIGWALAQELNIKFLTGDQKFHNKAHVEFVK